MSARRHHELSLPALVLMAAVPSLICAVGMACLIGGFR